MQDASTNEFPTASALARSLNRGPKVPLGDERRALRVLSLRLKTVSATRFLQDPGQFPTAGYQLAAPAVARFTHSPNSDTLV